MTQSGRLGLGWQAEGVLSAMISREVPGNYCEPAGQVNWYGSLRRVSLSRAGSERAGARGAADAGAVCQALRKDEQERLHRRRGDCGGSRAAEDALRTDQER